MKHALMYAGGFERNFPMLKPGLRTFVGTDGAEHPLPDWPTGADGVRVSYMEKAGKKFAAVRIQHDKIDLVLTHEVILEQGRHLGFGNRFSPEPTLVDDDDMALELLADILAKNPELRNDLGTIRSKLPKKKKD